MKEEALKLAHDGLNSEGLSYPETWNLCIKQARIIRRLVEEFDFQKKANIDLLLKNTYSNRTIELLNEELDKPHPKCDKACMYLCQTKPISYEEIENLREYHGINDWMYETSIVDFVRAVEKAHGIQ